MTAISSISSEQKLKNHHPKHLEVEVKRNKLKSKSPCHHIIQSILCKVGAVVKVAPNKLAGEKEKVALTPNTT